MSKAPPFRKDISSGSDDDEEYLSASSNILPSPLPARPRAKQLQPVQNQQGQPIQTAIATSTTAQPAPPPPPPKPALTTRGTTTAGGKGSLQKPSLAKRVRSVGFVDDLKNPPPSSSDWGDAKTGPSGTNNKFSPRQQGGLPRPGILSQKSRISTGGSSSNSAAKPKTQHYTLDQVISSQFENEATTHILAALEAAERKKEIDINDDNHLDSMERGGSENTSRLLGEGIDEQGEVGHVTNGNTEAGMEDYSEDEDDYGGVPPPPPPPPRDSRDGESLSSHSHSNSNSNSPISSSGPSHIRQDSFLQRVRMQNNQGGIGSANPSPIKHGSDWLSSVVKNSPDSGTPLSSEINRKRNMTGIPAGEVHQPAEEVHSHLDDSDRSNSRIGRDINFNVRHDDGEVSPIQRKIPPEAKNAPETNTTTTLANRLRNLQRQRGINTLSRLSRRSFRSSTASDADISDLGDEPESSGDKLLDALSRAEQSRNKSWRGRIKAEYNQLIVPRIPQLKRSISISLFLFIFPCLAVASLLFYILDNPMAGDSNTSWSWWIIFFARQMIILEFTKIGDIFWIETMALRSSFFQLAVGPYVSLAFIQSKGWPYVICFWGILDFCFLYGSNPFPKHWLFWQSSLDIFNERNPVDGVTDSEIYMRLLISMIFIGVAVSLKRLGIALYLGRRTVGHFGTDLEKLMAKMILIGEVATLASDIESKQSAFYRGSLSPMNADVEDEKMVRFREFVQNADQSSVETPVKSSRKSLGIPASTSLHASPGKPAVAKRGSSAEGSHISVDQPRRVVVDAIPESGGEDSFKDAAEISSSANAHLLSLLSEWEEPEVLVRKNSKANVQDLLQFRKAVSYMDDKYPFSHAFGPARTRELCVDSAQRVYERLMLSTDAGVLPFSVFTSLALDENGELVDAKMKSLIRLFRPDRNGSLIKLDFVKSIDTVYKELRLLRASIANSAQIDHAFERIVNFFYYFVVGIIAISILGVKIWQLLLSLMPFFLGFSFLFGSAASNYFEGLLLIFVRRPYDIGDKIATSKPANDTNPNGSSTWFVDRVTLFTTTVRFATTNEVATYSNGSLASLRIINANRSPKAIVSIVIKFGLETPFHRISVFRTAVENFVQARPREWVALTGFRATRVEADFGYVEYKIVCQHRESWQNIGPILQSKADLASFCLEVTKKLEMRYESPPMPVNLSASGMCLRDLLNNEDGTVDNEEQGNVRRLANTNKSMSADDLEDIAALFQVRE